MQKVYWRIQTRPQAPHFIGLQTARGGVVISRARAALEETSATVSTSSTTLPIILEAADAPASMCEHSMVGESAGIVRKGQTASRWDVPCAGSGRARGQRCGAGACAPCWSGAMPASSRPAIPSLRAACRGACESDARQENDIEQRGCSAYLRRRRGVGVRRGGRPARAGELGALYRCSSTHRLASTTAESAAGRAKDGDIL